MCNNLKQFLKLSQILPTYYRHAHAFQSIKQGMEFWEEEGGSGGRSSTGASLCLIDTIFMCVCVCVCACVFRGVKCIYTELPHNISVKSIDFTCASVWKIPQLLTLLN